MTKISKKMSLKEFAIFVASKLKEADIDVILTGGAVVSIYTNNKYRSRDLDFLSPTDHQSIKKAMYTLGFESSGKDFYHTDSDFTVEFPGYELVIGETAMRAEGKVKLENFTLKLLSPTQCVMDRLSAFYHWKDIQSLKQALMVAKVHPINLGKIENWSKNEGMLDKYQVFLKRLKPRK
jgi:hypothetical protein